MYKTATSHTPAYSDLYLSNAKNHLGFCFNFLINSCRIPSKKAMMLFITTGIAAEFGKGNPFYVAGMSGTELGIEILSTAYQDYSIPECSEDPLQCSPEFWAGFSLAEYQWYSGKSFEEIDHAVPLADILSMYSVYHEIDMTFFVDEMERRVSAFYAEQAENTPADTIKRLRAYLGLSQSLLAERTGVKLRSIQMYEQGVYDLKKAEAGTVLKLAKGLGCSVEELLE